MTTSLINGDCLAEMAKLADNSVDLILTDPPYELGFMGKSWDSTGIANNIDMWAQALRVLKPGGYLLAFSGTRTYHRMASAIEDAGFEVRDMIEWVYGSGFPKSRNIGLDVDKRNGVTKNRGKAFVVAGQSGRRDKDTGGDLVPGSNTMGAYIAQNEWSGWGTALKPAHEPICMARKPLAEKTVAENCLKWGTGGINIDESRVGNGDDRVGGGLAKENFGINGMPQVERPTGARFPANLIHDNSEEVKECFPDTNSKGHFPSNNKNGNSMFNTNNLEQEEQWLDDSGNASRFFKSILYFPKASKSDRNAGCDGLEEKEGIRTNAPRCSEDAKIPVRANNHPTVKPTALMEYLATMCSRENATILDPFMGSGTTGVACVNTNRNFIGIELDKGYFEIATTRIHSAISNKANLLL